MKQLRDFGLIFAAANLLRLIGKENYNFNLITDPATNKLIPQFTLKEGAVCTFESW